MNWRKIEDGKVKGPIIHTLLVKIGDHVRTVRTIPFIIGDTVHENLSLVVAMIVLTLPIGEVMPDVLAEVMEIQDD